MDLTLTDCDMVHYHLPKVAAAASCLSQNILGQGTWNFKQQCYTGHAENEVLEVVQRMAKNVVTVNENLMKFIAIKNKNSSSKLLKIRTIPQLNSEAMQELASPLMDRSLTARALGEVCALHLHFVWNLLVYFMKPLLRPIF